MAAMKTLILTLFSLPLSLTIASAETILPGGCFVRSYSEQHLKDHPQQQVTYIALSPSPLSDGGAVEEIDLFIQVRSTDYQYHALAYCQPIAGGSLCSIEGDGGQFTLTPAKGRDLYLTVQPGGLGLEGQTETLRIEADRGDDRKFRIPPTHPDMCS